MAQTNINLRVHALYNKKCDSKETFADIDQTGRDQMFRGDSIEKKNLI